MLKTIHALRAIVGLIAAWQILGLLPTLGWLTHIESTTVNMWAMALVKFFVLLVCGTLYFILGLIKRKINPASVSKSELKVIGIAIATIALGGATVAIFVSVVTEKSPLEANALELTSSESNTLGASGSPPPTGINPQSTPQIGLSDTFLQMRIDQLSYDQYSAALDRWLEHHPDVPPSESKIVTNYLQEVYAKYPRISLGAALDMAHQRGQKNTKITEQAAAPKFLCDGSYTKNTKGDAKQLPISGIVISVGDAFVTISGAGIFDGTLDIITKLDRGVGFKDPHDDTLEGFFNKYSGELSLIDREGPVNADGSFQMSAYFTLKCRPANAMF